jgi:S1-C subfamily serine protease
MTTARQIGISVYRPLGMSSSVLSLMIFGLIWGWPGFTSGWVQGSEPQRVGADTKSGAKSGTATASLAQPVRAANTQAEPSREGPRLDARKIYQRMLRGSAWVTVRLSATENHAGTAWLVDSAERLLITSHHVVSSKDLWTVHDNLIKVFFPENRNGTTLSDPEAVLRDGKSYKAHIVDSDPGRDLAILQVEELPADLKPLPLSQEGCQPAEYVHSIGNSGGQALWVYTSGTVRQVFRKDLFIGSLRKIRVKCVETQTPINPGDSGGPVVNDDGQVVAVNTLARSLVGVPSSPIAVAVDVSEVRALLDEVRPFLHPVNADKYNLRGLRYLARERISPALEDFSEALKLLPAGADRVPILRNRGRAHSAKGVQESAIRDFTQALELKARDLETLIARGEAYLLASKFKAAEADFNMAIQVAEAAHIQSDLLAKAYFGLGMVPSPK